MPYYLVILITLLASIQQEAIGQHVIFTSNFSFGKSSLFIRDTDQFTINSDEALQLNGNAYADTAAIGFLQTDSSWQEQQLQIQLKFSPSATNLFRWILASNTTNNNDSFSKSYFIEVGENGSGDTWRLKKKNGLQITELLHGSTGQLSKASNIFRLRVRNCRNIWRIWIDSLGSHQFDTPLTLMDSINFNCQYTGIECIYTSTRNKSTIIDDWYIGDSINDYTPPYINTITIENGNRLSILFSEALRKESISRLHFSIDGIFVDSAYRDEKNFALVHITNITMLSEGLHYIFSSNLTDEAANNLMGVNSPFRFKRAHYGDIIVSEFMADPSPTITLPETEYIELFNNSEDSINLTNFYLGDSSSLNRIGNHSWIHKDEYLLITSINNCKLFGKVRCLELTGFPSLNNSGDKIILLNSDSALVDALEYNLEFYKSSYKQNGGFSIERQDLQSSCNNLSNWEASKSSSGGTPGYKNSQSKTMSPHESFKALFGEVVSSNLIEVHFNSPININDLDKAIAINAASQDTFSLSNYDYKKPTVLSFTSINTLDSHSIYSIHIMSIRDCYGQDIDTEFAIDIALGYMPDSGEILINELLFNPITFCDDYLEIFNQSNRTIDLSKIKITKGSSNGTRSYYTLFSHTRNIGPHEYMCLTKTPNEVRIQYPKNNGRNIIQVDNICSMNNDSDYIQLWNTKGVLIEEASYSEKFHNTLLQKTEGVALERRSLARSALCKENWMSGCASYNFGSPGLENPSSLEKGLSDSSKDWILYPKVLTPNGDGESDYLFIKANFNTTETIAEVKIIDQSGQIIKAVCSPQTISNQEWPIWNGLSEDCRVGPSAIYFTWIRYGELGKKTKTVLLPFYLKAL